MERSGRTAADGAVPATGPAPRAVIELRLEAAAQLIDLRDRSPFRDDGMLVAEAAEHLARHARTLPPKAPIRIAVRLPPAEAARPEAARIGTAITGHFARRTEAETEAMGELFRNGRASAVIGLSILSACLFAAWHISGFSPTRPLTRIAQESMIILGWVSMWKPAEVFVYEWVPIARHRRLYRRLAAAEVAVLAWPRAP